MKKKLPEKLNLHFKDHFYCAFEKQHSDYYATIREVSQGLSAMLDVNDICNFIGEVIFSSLDLKNILILSGTPDGEYGVAYSRFINGHTKSLDADERDYYEFKIGRQSSIVKFLESYDGIIIKDGLNKIEEEIGADVVKNMRNEIESMHGEIVVPVFIDEKLELLLVLGEKVSNSMITGNDIELMNTISCQTSISIKHVRLYKEKIHSERLASIGMMSATFAHEIRNPLTSLKTFAQLIPEKYNDAEFRDKFSKIVLGEMERIEGLIEDLLDFSAQKKTPGINHFDIKELFDEMIQYLTDKHHMEKRKILIKKNYAGREINLSGNTKKLKHAFLNIINNGCQAMKEEGVLIIDVMPKGKNIEVAIADTGEGIPPEHLGSIYEPFVTTKEMGMGLGLAISKKIIEDHGGKINVISKLSEGTTFTVSLPLNGC